MTRLKTQEYEIIITEISESDTPHPPVATIQMQDISPEAAVLVISDLLKSIAKHNHLSLDRLNTNLYHTQWINGI